MSSKPDSVMELRMSYLRPFIGVTVVVLILESVFNREFLASVLPLGLSGMNVFSFATPIRVIYVVGGQAYGWLTLFVPVTLIAASILLNWRSVGARVFEVAAIASVLFALIMDFEHMSAGLNNIFGTPPVLLSLLLLAGVFLGTAAAAVTAFRAREMLSISVGLMLLTELLGLALLFGNIVTSSYRVELGSVIAGYFAQLEPYFGSVGGILFGIFGGAQVFRLSRAKIGIYLASLTVGILVEFLVMANVVKGSSIVLGTIIIYDFGFYGVTNQLVSVVVFSAIFAFVTALFLALTRLKRGGSRNYQALAALVLIMTGLVFDSENVTTYILLPLMGALLIFISVEFGDGRLSSARPAPV